MTGAPANKLTRLSVEYSLTEHCNISCHACAHASPLLAKKFADLSDFTRDFEALAEVFHSRELRIVGGEPLLHPELLAFLREGRRIGIADTIVVYTNGVLLHRMPDEFWRLIDKLHVSVYPGVRRRLDEEDCARLCRTHDVELCIERFRTFDQTLISKRSTIRSWSRRSTALATPPRSATPSTPGDLQMPDGNAHVVMACPA